MTNQELIEKLKKLPLDKEVVLVYTYYADPEDSVGLDAEIDWFQIKEDETKIILR